MVLQLTATQLQTITNHAQRTYPEECCGLLIGQLQRQENREIRTLTEIWSTDNAWDAAAAESIAAVISSSASNQDLNQTPNQPLDPTKAEHYWIDPQEMLKAQRYAREHDLNIIGIYHSHPDHPAMPSECDRLLAWAQYSYIIVSVQQGIAEAVKCWMLDDHHQFQPEELTVL